ncbi:MAG: hypothetical protein QM535_14740 [Limnohabitans sp.]|nr:hypothetical protein [Limnohabitans sp.]
MKKKLFALLFFSVLITNKIWSQEQVYKVYQGKMDKYNITLFLREEISGCGPSSFTGMYKYDNLSKWLFLEISDDESNKLVLVEAGITGILSLKKTGKILEGFWISPNGNKILKVKLIEKPSGKTQLKKLSDTLDKLNYEMNDC